MSNAQFSETLLDSKVDPDSQPGRYANMTDTLLRNVARFDTFATDENDEFQITREDGRKQGIFKVWALPVIPQLEITDRDVDSAIVEWTESLTDRPLALYESMEEWRSFSAVTDRRLQSIFANRELPADPQDAIVELVLRQSIAFAFTSPFYHLEALVADSRDKKADNPIDFSETESGRGKLDVVAMLLPAALKDKLHASRSDWNGCSWADIDQSLERMRSDFLSGEKTLESAQYVLLSKVGHLAGIDPRVVLFAANALEFIPSDVGGKSDDIPQDDALETLLQVLDDTPDNLTTLGVAKETNALIRFLNWCPVILSERNFQCQQWSYDAACATAGSLVSWINGNTESVF
ncbi:MAG: hypothetical protein AAB624_03495, partial [Patescibacteria group bacterium]